jgi:hypothetical protein
MKAHRVYVVCQSDDDLPYVLKSTGEDNRRMGTDYGHHDHAADREGLRNLKPTVLLATMSTTRSLMPTLERPLPCRPSKGATEWP